MKHQYWHLRKRMRISEILLY